MTRKTVLVATLALIAVPGIAFAGAASPLS
jgi:hypothetical protein